MAETPAKKAKAGDTLSLNSYLDDSIYDLVRKDEKVLNILKEETKCIRNGYSGMIVKALKITEITARANESFSKAKCKSESYVDSTFPPSFISYPFGSLFSNGMATLEKYIEESKIPCDRSSQKALRKLLHFLNYSSLSSLKNPGKHFKRSDWAVQLAQHLFSQLAVDNKYTIDKRYQSKAEMIQTKCEKRDMLTDEYGDTSFGCPDAWHGSVDIYLDNVTVQLTSDDDGNDDGNDGGNDDVKRGRTPSNSSDYNSESSGHVNTGDNFLDSSDQMLAQCIVFSFLQRNMDDAGKMCNHLIPSFGVDKSMIVIFFYDSQNDVLLQSKPLHLFDVYGILNIETVICVWLAVNYKCFCTGITKEMKTYKAGFHEHVGEYLVKYETQVLRPVETMDRKITSSENVLEGLPLQGKDNPVTLDFRAFIVDNNRD